MIRHLGLVVAALVCLSAPSSASAYWPYMGYGGWYGWGGGWGYNAPTNYVPAPPYYAIHPPVYYSSTITARHYGASPFAWYPGLQPITYTPAAQPEAVAAVEPQMIENPFVKAKAEVRPASTTAAEVEPLRIRNPFVASVNR